MSLKPGWEGRFFDDFLVGDISRHPLGRTVTQTGNIRFTLLTMNTDPIRFDASLATKTPFGKPLSIAA